MKRLALILVLLGLFQLVVFSATPTISNISVTTDTNTAVVTYHVSPDSYCWVQYGIASGAYLWSSVSFQSGASFVPGLCAVPINGLKDGTTYYFLPTARPNPDDENNGCMTATQACGTSEQTATTPAASVSHLPASPNSVQGNLMIEPHTTGQDNYAGAYVVVPLTATGNGGECVSAATVSAPAGYSGSISTGDSLTTILGAPGKKLWYGTIFQVPQGTTCIVPRFSPRGRGYELPPLAIDPNATNGQITADNHRWIVFRTVENNAADFPPFGARTGPAFQNHMGGFQTANYNSIDTAMDTNGTIFDATGAGQVHHIWIENLMFSVDATNPRNYDVMFLLGRGGGGQSPPFPQYIVMRGNYFHGPVRGVLTSGVPSIQGVLLSTMQPNMQYAIVGNYTDNVLYTGAAGIPQAFNFTDCGFTGSCGFGGPALIDNNYVDGMAMGIYIEVNNHANPTPYDFTVTHNSLYWPYSPTYSYALSIGSYGCRNQIEYKGMNRGVITGNYINGQWACANTGNSILTFNAVDLTIQSNLITNSASGFGLSGTGNSNIMMSYSSSANRILVNNNLLFNLGRSMFQAGGGGVGAPAIEMDSSPSNVTITNNTFGPIGNDNPITNPPTPGFFYPYILMNIGGGQLAGLTVQNNIFPFGLGQTAYGGGIGIQNALSATGTLSHPATPLPNSTVSPVNFSSWLGSIAGYTSIPGTTLNGPKRGPVGLGIQGVTLIAGGAGYPNSGVLSFSGCTSPPSGTFTAVGGVIQNVTVTNFGLGCNPAIFTASARGGGTGAALRPAYGLTTSYSWSGNVNYCTTYQGVDMNYFTCRSLSATMPSGDIWVSGPGTAARMAAAGLVHATSNDYRCVPTTQSACTAGANLDRLESDLGIVSHISVTESQFSYVAPDSRACSVDFSADNGATWTRSSDSGGSVQRSVPLTGLSTGVPYQYRLLCYYDQTQPWFSFPSDSSTLATSGTFTAGTPGIIAATGLAKVKPR